MTKANRYCWNMKCCKPVNFDLWRAEITCYYSRWHQSLYRTSLWIVVLVITRKCFGGQRFAGAVGTFFFYFGNHRGDVQYAHVHFPGTSRCARKRGHTSTDRSRKASERSVLGLTTRMTSTDSASTSTSLVDTISSVRVCAKKPL